MVSYPGLYLKENILINGINDDTVLSDNPVKYASQLANSGAKKIVIFDMSYDEESSEKTLSCIRAICRKLDIPVIGTGNICSIEDVKKILYAGCKICAIDISNESNDNLIKEAANKFGKEKIAVCINDIKQYNRKFQIVKDKTCGLISINQTQNLDDFVITEGLMVAKVDIDKKDHNYKVEINCKYKWEDLKKNSDGMVPVVVQDYKTDELLMVAYMNEEAYNKTIDTGVMTYYSRSRQELWIKGLTSTHFQYVKSMYMDCDLDTILVKVAQVGSACHTGRGSCFFNEAFKLNDTKHNPTKVLDEVMTTILDRKENPKEGSYTNYLFDKGLDKILKKVGEEATEIVIASKNSEKEEVKYEIADFLYHVMVLMAQKDITWEDIAEELSNR